ncbi:MAG: Hsp70 family protein [Micromonosporaceae bacterium]|nr:Hsp70 family protein [Micromonosporaceae bacterium]
MPYVLGIDIGGTTTTAAISQLSGGGFGAPEVVRLGARSHSVPSALHLAPDRALTVADPVPLDASRVARGFSRRVGDDVPLVVGGEPCPPQALTAVLAMWVVEQVQLQQGAPAERVVISHPAGWGGYRRGLLLRAIREIGLAGVSLLPEPVLVAESHRQHGWPGDTLAVYTLGGSDFETSLVGWAERAGFRLLGSAASVDPFGGTDVDEALVNHVQAALGSEFRTLRRDGPQARLALFGLRRECARAKERLSAATETEVLVPLPYGQVEVPISRTELEALIRPALQVTVDALIGIVRSGGRGGDPPDRILLAGGAAQMPLVAELVAAGLPGSPIAVEPEPQHTAATGAAVVAAKIATMRPAPELPAGSASGPPAGRPPNPDPDPPEQVADGTLGEEPPPRPPVKITPLKLPRARAGQRRLGLVGVRL